MDNQIQPEQAVGKTIAAVVVADYAIAVITFTDGSYLHISIERAYESCDDRITFRAAYEPDQT